MLLLLLVVLPFLSAYDDEKPLKILVYSMKNSYSHANFIGRLSDVLVEGGLNVTTLISEVRTDISDGTSKSTIIRVEPQEEAYKLWNTGEMPPIFDGSTLVCQSNLDSSKNPSCDQAWGQLGFLLGSNLEICLDPTWKGVFLLQCRHLLTKTEMIEQLRKEEYDAVIGETFDYCGFGLAKLIGAKTVIATFSSSLNDYTAWITGTPSPWSVTQASYSGVLDRSISSRLWNLLCVAVDYYVNWSWAGAANEAFRERFGDEFPSVEEMVANSSLIITAGDPLLDLSRPTQRKIVDIGAIGIRDANPLDKEYDAILNLRPKTVLFSMGSVARSASLFDEYKAALAKTFKKFPDVTFIWKYEEPDNAPHVAGLDNVILRKWIPQNDLLGDGRVSALITHGGKTSLNEVGAKGLPAVFIPIYGDQTKNAAIAVKLGFGYFLNKLDLSNSGVIEEAIRAVLYDEKYSIAAKRVAATIRGRPFSPKELLVKHVKFAARFGNVKSLDQEGLDYPLYIYWNLDILSLLLIIPLLGAMFLGWSILKYCRRTTTVDKTKNKQN